MKDITDTQLLELLRSYIPKRQKEHNRFDNSFEEALIKAVLKAQDQDLRGAEDDEEFETQLRRTQTSFGRQFTFGTAKAASESEQSSTTAQEPTIRHLLKDLKERKGFFEFYKKRLLPKHREERSFQDDFFRKCDQEHVNPLPALNKVRNKVLSLTGYALNAGNCKALEEGLRGMDKRIRKLYLENNNCTDDMFSRILEGLRDVSSLKSVTYILNDFGPKSTEKLIALLHRPAPHALEELRIENCKISTHFVNTILEELRDRCPLRKLALVRAKLNEISLMLLTEIVEVYPFLVAIDISWNELLGPPLIEFVETLATVKRVQYVNLSWNNLEIEEVVEHLYSLLKSSKSLLHLDLTSTGLREKSVERIVRGVKRAPSLLSLHLGGNEVTPALRERFRKQLKARVRPHLKGNALRLAATSVGHNIEGIQNMFVQQDKHFYCKRKEFEGSAPTLNYTRILGLRDLAADEQWLETEDCWICDKWLYTVLFWNRKIGLKFYTAADCSELEQRAFVEQMKQRTAGKGEELLGECPGVPMINASFMAWKPQLMLSTVEFCKIVDKNYKPPEMPTDEKGRPLNTKAAFDWVEQLEEEIRQKYTVAFDAVFEQ